MKKLSAIDLFLKADNAGRRNPTVLTWILLCLLVFSSIFSRRTKTREEEKGTPEGKYYQGTRYRGSGSFFR